MSVLDEKYEATLTPAQVEVFKSVQENLGLSDEDLVAKFDRRGTRPGWAVLDSMLAESNFNWTKEHSDEEAGVDRMNLLESRITLASKHEATRNSIQAQQIALATEVYFDLKKQALLNPGSLVFTVGNTSPLIDLLSQALDDVLKEQYRARKARESADTSDDTETITTMQAEIAAKVAAEKKDPWGASNTK